MLKRPYNLLLYAYVLFATSPAYAAFTKANSMLRNIEGGLRGLSLVTVTIAVFWVGYKVLFGGSTLRECTPVIIGAILIASASEIARMLA